MASPQPEPPKRTLALIVTHGSHNNLAMVANLIMGAVACQYRVRAFFRDEAVLKLRKDRIHELNVTPGLEPIRSHVEASLKKEDAQIPYVLRAAKRSGDVKLYVCSSSLAMVNTKRSDLIDEVDGVMGVTTFLLEHLQSADLTLTF